MLKDRKPWASDIGNELSSYPLITNSLMQPNKLQAYQFAQSWQTDFKYIDTTPIVRIISETVVLPW